MKKLLIGLLIVIVALAIGFFAPAFLKPTLTHENRVMVNKPPAEVWEKFSNTDNLPKWIEGFKSIETISGEPNQVGSKYKVVIEDNGQTFEATETVKEIVENEKFAFELDSDMATTDVEFTLINKGLSTEVVEKDTFTGKGIFWKALFYWMQSSMKERSKTNLERFKKFAEES